MELTAITLYDNRDLALLTFEVDSKPMEVAISEKDAKHLLEKAQEAKKAYNGRPVKHGVEYRIIY